MRLLIVRLGAFGDILHTLPLAADLAAAGHTCGWLCEDRWAAVLDGSPVVERIHRLPRRLLRDRGASWRVRVEALRDLLRELRQAGYDGVIDAQGLAKSALLARAVGAPLMIGHGLPRSRELAWLFADQRVRSSAVHVIDQQRDLARAVGLVPVGPWRFPLPAWTAARQVVEAWLAESGLVRPWMLNVGAGWPTKVWPEEQQRAFLEEARRAGVPVVVVWGSPAERAVAERLVADAGHGRLSPPTDLPQLCCLLSRAAVVISGDTGPLHAGLAVGVPTIGLFGPVPRERNGPRGERHQNFQAPGAAWERRDVSKVDMGAIRAEAVFRAAADVALPVT